MVVGRRAVVSRASSHHLNPVLDLDPKGLNPNLNLGRNWSWLRLILMRMTFRPDCCPLVSRLRYKVQFFPPRLYSTSYMSGWQFLLPFLPVAFLLFVSFSFFTLAPPLKRFHFLFLPILPFFCHHSKSDARARHSLSFFLFLFLFFLDWYVRKKNVFVSKMCRVVSWDVGWPGPLEE